jgi:hypothetical protein
VTLRPGCLIVVAPSFQLQVDWRQRILLGSGIESDGDGFFPRPDWRQPDAAELDLLARPPLSPPTRESLEKCLCLFQIPQHLYAAWWHLVETAPQPRPLSPERRGENPARVQGFDAFVAKVAEFLAFKELHVPEGALFELLLSAPGLRSIHQNDMPPGLTVSSRLWGGLNLGEESTSLVFINLPPADLLAEMRRHSPDPQSPETASEVGHRFLTMCADYPPVRLRLESGDGFRLPVGGLVVDFSTLDGTEPAVLLLIREANP